MSDAVELADIGAELDGMRTGKRPVDAARARKLQGRARELIAPHRAVTVLDTPAPSGDRLVHVIYGVPAEVFQ